MPIEATPPKSLSPVEPFKSDTIPTIYELRESLQVEEEYRDDVVRHMSVMEQQTRSDPGMMSMQPELQWHMRPYLLDFLIESHLGLQLAQETLFLAVNIADRYSSMRVVFKRHYQLVGCTSLWIASKYSDKKNKVPTLDELKLICCNAYESHMFTQMELHILHTLDWSIGHPTVDLYLDLCFGNIKPQDITCAQSARHISLYLCENALYCKELVSFLPSVIAKSAFKLGLLFLTMGNMPFKANDEEEALCIDVMSRACTKPTSCLERKYSLPEYSSAMRYIREFNEHQLLHQQHEVDYDTSVGSLATPAPTPTKNRDDYFSIKREGRDARYLTPESSPTRSTMGESTSEDQNIIVITTTADMRHGEYESLLAEGSEDDDDCMEDEDISTVIYDTNSLG